MPTPPTSLEINKVETLPPISQREISKSVPSNIDKHRVAEAHKARFDKDLDRARTSSSFCLGRIGSMLAVYVSAGVGTSY
jgi:hypothetical protein